MAASLNLGRQNVKIGAGGINAGTSHRNLYAQLASIPDRQQCLGAMQVFTGLSGVSGPVVCKGVCKHEFRKQAVAVTPKT